MANKPQTMMDIEVNLNADEIDYDANARALNTISIAMGRDNVKATIWLWHLLAELMIGKVRTFNVRNNIEVDYTKITWTGIHAKIGGFGTGKEQTKGSWGGFSYSTLYTALNVYHYV